MILDDLLSRRMIVLTGKGGVGKSVVGMALALAARKRGKRVLLVEIDAPLEAARHLGAPPSGYHETEIAPGLFTLNLDPAQALDEYVRRVVRVELLVRKVLDSPIYQKFLAFAPGLPELMTLGKIMTLEEAHEGWSRRFRYDLVVVDAPATGHGLAFLKVPLAASRAVPVGPVGNNARRILALLRNPRRTALVLTAIPEEMAVVEALEFHRLATEELDVRPVCLVLNACHERRFSDAQEAEVLRLAASSADGRLARGVRLAGALAAGRRQIRRRKLTRFYQARLKKALPLPILTLPYLFDDSFDSASLDRLAERLEAQ